MGNKEDLIKKGESIVESAGLPKEDFELWKNALRGATLAHLAFFVDAFESDRELLLHTTDMLKKKIAAGHDVEKILQVVSEEKELLKKALES